MKGPKMEPHSDQAKVTKLDETRKYLREECEEPDPDPIAQYWSPPATQQMPLPVMLLKEKQEVEESDPDPIAHYSTPLATRQMPLPAMLLEGKQEHEKYEQCFRPKVSVALLHCWMAR